MFESKKRKTSYVGAYYDHKNDAVIVWERDAQGNRVVVPYEAPYYFYVPDEDGEYKSIFDDKLKRLDFGSRSEFENALNKHRNRFESDISPLFRVLMDEYYESAIPDVHFAFLDIENNYAAELGWSTVDNPYADINAVTIWQSWTCKFITVATLPPELSKRFNKKKFDKFVASISKEHKLLATPDVIIANDEAELLDILIDSIENADIISGWNSEFFDIPYIIKRLERVRPKLVQRMCFPGCRPPREKTVERFGTPSTVYSLSGRTHLDYLDLVKKFTFEGRTSYSLSAVTSDELDAPKMEHEESLEQLYKGTFFPSTEGLRWKDLATEFDDELEILNRQRALLKDELAHRAKTGQTSAGFIGIGDDEIDKQYSDIHDDVLHLSFAKFCCYNTHDVGCLVGLDKKFKFIALVNQMAHENTCLFENMTGTVRYVETGIANRTHYVHKRVVMDKRIMTDGEKVEGALVLNPLAGLHKWLGSVDITSLYPSVIRAICISPELYIGQFAGGELDWRGIKDGDDLKHTLRDDNGDTITMTGHEWRELLIENKWALSAYGTVFDQSKGPGIVDATLAFWFAERKRLKKEMDNWKKKRKEIAKDHLYSLSDEEYARYKEGSAEFDEIRGLVKDSEIYLDGTSFYSKDIYDLLLEADVQIARWDLLQLTKKIQL